MRVSSFKEDAKGKVSERIDVLVDDGDEERDISTYSGGEKNFLEYVFRVAFSILQAERSGKGLKVLVLDEPMYFADDCLSDSFMRILNKLKDKFNQIFIISHSDHILSTIENKIHFSRGENGFCQVQTEYVGV
jgi:DNA repair exonuclease SbcCD ATPase subunit